MNKNYLLELVMNFEKTFSLYKVNKFQKSEFRSSNLTLLTGKITKMWVSRIVFRERFYEFFSKPQMRLLAFIFLGSVFNGSNGQNASSTPRSEFETHADMIYSRFKHIKPMGTELWNAFEPDFDASNFNGGGACYAVNHEISQEILRSALQYKYGLENYREQDSIWQERIYGYLEQGIFPIGVVDLRFNEINPVLLKAGLRWSADSSHYELNLDGFADPIFKENYVFAGILPIERMRNDVEWMVLDSAMWVSNFNKPEKIRVRLNQEVLWVEWNVPFKVPAGTENLDMEIDFLLDEEDERGQYMEDAIQWNPFKIFSKSRVTISRNPYIPVPVFNQNEIRVHEYSNPNKSVFHKARYTVHFGLDSTKNGIVQHNCIRKPLVIVEGVDYGYPGIRGLKDNKFGENGYIDILNGKTWNAASQSWERWKSIEKGPYLIKRLRNMGYDIIYVDFYDGAADININADVFQGVLEEIKKVNCGNSIHVIGISMGGLVAKRALRKMENEGISHCVTSFTSFDVPYWGANIPLGLQHLIRYYSQSKEMAKDGLHRILRRPASMQMLANHEASGKQHHSYRTLFMREDSLFGGFPQKPMLFCITNGAAKGTDSRQPDAWGTNAKMQPGQLIFRLQMKGLSAIKTTPWVDIFAENFFDKKNQVYFSGKVAGAKPFYTHKDNHLWDHVSGSQINKFGSLRRVSGMLKVGLEAPYTCFVPTISALSLMSSIHSFNSMLDLPLSVKENDAFQPLGGEIQTPFMRIYIPTENQDHVMLDSTPNGNIEWLIEQLENADNGFQLGNGGSISKSNGVYNLNSPWNKFLPGGQLSGTAVLEVNGSGLIPQLSSSNLMLAKSLKKRDFYTGSCTFTRLKLTEQSKLQVGHTGGSQTVVHWDGNSELTLNGSSSFVLKENHSFLIKKGARVILDDSSTLELHSGAKFIIEEGGWLILRGNAQLILDKESELHIKGNIVLGDGYNFKPVGRDGEEVGLVKITNKGYGFGKGEVFFEGVDAQFVLNGNGKLGKGSFQIEGLIQWPEAKKGSPLKSVVIERTQGIFGPGSRLIVSGDVRIEDSRFVMVDWANQFESGKMDAGIRYSGKGLKLKDVAFEQLDTALVVKLNKGGKSVLWQQLKFENCGVGMVGLGLTGRMDQCDFLGNKIGLIANEVEQELVITESNFKNNAEGIISNQNAGSSSKLWVIESLFDRNITAMSSLYGNLILKCNRFNLSESDIIVEGGVLNMSGEEYIKSDVLSRKEKPGFNVFVNSKKRCVGVYGSELFINGENYFYFNKLKYDGRPFVEGQVKIDETKSYWNQTKGCFKSGKNVWAPSKDLDSSDLDVQYIRLVRENRGNGVLDVEGSLMKYYPAEACFYASELNPNELVVQKLSGDNSDKNEKVALKSRVFGVAGGIMIWGKDLDWECYNAAGSLIKVGKTTLDKEFVEISSGIYFIRLKDSQLGASFKVFVSEN